MKITSKLDLEYVLQSAQDDRTTGFCIACANEQGECEPDARRRRCENCGEMTVYGAEEIMMMVGFSTE